MSSCLKCVFVSVVLASMVFSPIFAKKSERDERPVRKSDALQQQMVTQQGSTVRLESARSISPQPGKELVAEHLKTRLDSVQSTISATGEQITWHVFSSSGGSGSSASYGLLATIGQTAVGTGSSTSYVVNHGFVQADSGGGCCIGTRGDVNYDGADLDIVDLTCVVDFLFGSGCAQPCPEEADVNGDGSTSDIVDLTFVVDWLFGVAPTLVACP